MSEQHFFLGEEWLGSRQIPTFTDLGDGAKVAPSYALFCPHCAKVWGKMMHDHKDAFCNPIVSSCLAHASFPSDATFTSYHGRYAQGLGPRDWNDDLPEAVMRHDIKAICSFYLAEPRRLLLINYRHGK